MNVILLLLLFLGIFGFGAWSEATEVTSAGQTCVVTESGVDRCGPEMTEHGYQMPADGVVIAVRVNNGPVAPDSQEGYEIEIEADGTVAITVTPLGSSDQMSASERTAEQEVRSDEIGVEGVQELLAELDACGFYYLPQRDEVDSSELPDGGAISVLEVTLLDGEWAVLNQALSDPADQAQLDECQSVLSDRFAIALD